MKASLALLSAATLIFCLHSAPAQASTMPKAEADQTSLAIGLGPSISFDSNLAPRLTLGGSLGLPFLVEGTNSGRYDVRMAYKFLQEGNFSLAGILGIWGNFRFDDPSRSRYAGLELGLGLSYRFTPQLTGRLNLVPGISFPFGPGRVVDYYPPASGFELGYRFTPTFEGTIGYNGQGDILGLRFLI